MPNAPRRSAFVLGMAMSLPYLLVIIPFGLLFGVLASEAGLGILHALGMSLTVVAGAAQFAALQLMVEKAPLALIVLSGLCVNLRMALYSASLAPFFGSAPLWQRAAIAYGLTDQTYGTAMQRFVLRPDLSVSERVSFFLGSIVVVCPPWYGATVAGAAFGGTIPGALALDFAVPITFVALFAPALRSLPHVAAASVATGTALCFAELPFSLWIPVAALAGMLAGAGAEALLQRAGR